MSNTNQKQAEEQPEAPKQEKATKSIYYLVKRPTYVYDAMLETNPKDRMVGEADVWEPGLYKVSGSIQRFDRSGRDSVEKYEGNIPEVKIHDIAKAFHVKTEDGKGNLRKSEDILADLVKERDMPKRQN